MNTAIVIISTAILTSILTLWGAYLVFRWVLARQLTTLRRHLDNELDQIAETLEERVKQGVERGAQDVLPEFRREVREGFKDALVAAVNGDVLTETTQSVARKGTRALRSWLFGDANEGPKT